MNEPDPLVEELRALVVQAAGLAIEPREIDPDAPMFGAGLGIDSIDALELTVLIEKNYGVRIEDRATGAEAFASIRALAVYISAHRSEARG